MKRDLLFLLLLNTALIGAHGQNVNNPFQYKTYYSIMPENFIGQIRFSRDSIFNATLNRELQPHGNKQSVSKIYEIIQKGNTFFFYIDQWQLSIYGKDTSKQHLGFNVIAYSVDGENRILSTSLHEGYKKTWKECRQQALWNPDDEFAFTIFASPMLDSFKTYSNITDMDTAAVCQLLERANMEYKVNEEKVKKISKYDLYLSGSTKELITRAMIVLRINPMNYTNEELGQALQKCVR